LTDIKSHPDFSLNFWRSAIAPYDSKKTAEMNQASQNLLVLAKKSIQAYINHPNVKAAIVTGSTATGEADIYSDVEMFIYYDCLPSIEELQLARHQNRGSEPILIFDDRDMGHFGEFYYIDGVQFQIGNSTIEFWEGEMAVVLEQLDVTSPLQKALSGMLDCIPLYGEELISQWKSQIANYPDALARKMVEKHLNFFPLWAVREHLAARDTTLFQHQIRLEAGQNLLGVLAGLNRLYYSTFQFKRMKQFITQMNIAPENLYVRLESLFHIEPLVAANQIKELVAETVELVELHLPEIDTSKVRKSLERQ
jgi:predicted nucleotidyltransferase